MIGCRFFALERPIDVLKRLIASTLFSALFLNPTQAAEFDLRTQEVQAALASYGYSPGPADGLYGRKTENSILLFQKEFRLEAVGQVDAELAASLGIDKYVSANGAEILILDQPSEAVADNFEGKNQREIISTINDLRRQSLNKINMKPEEPKSAVFIIDERILPGDIIHTQIEVIRRDLPKFFENFYYDVDESTSRLPMIIVNEVEAGWELQITHRVFLNGQLLATKRTRANR